ncbi:hypothetical protein BDN72DRAFT_684751 [Pluteus cervinus]|uniref:Uncharacterized protein n=1 Tax=Pluteus cervinus TaxID=181527 RepID=A0ACD3AR48_9AGAR|nr:hypothetical protein BDN72DRAFT_684751 [Pluteus cervinus]
MLKKKYHNDWVLAVVGHAKADDYIRAISWWMCQAVKRVDMPFTLSRRTPTKCTAQKVIPAPRQQPAARIVKAVSSRLYSTRQRNRWFEMRRTANHASKDPNTFRVVLAPRPPFVHQANIWSSPRSKAPSLSSSLLGASGSRGCSKTRKGKKEADRRNLGGTYPSSSGLIRDMWLD